MTRRLALMNLVLPLWLGVLSSLLFSASVTGSETAHSEAAEMENATLAFTPHYKDEILKAVDKLVQEEFVDATKAKATWPKALALHRQSILAAADMPSFCAEINKALSKLKASHTQFICRNDEMFYFLHSLFSAQSEIAKGQKSKLSLDFTGLGIGGDGLGAKQVRYVLDGSPAAKAGFKRGDEIISVNAKEFVGQISFAGTANHKNRVNILRQGQRQDLYLEPKQMDAYSGYVQATESSVRVFKRSGRTLGYIHLWAGGQDCHEVLEDALSNKLSRVDGLILDLRDGYGGNSLADLDYFYRNPSNYPTFKTKSRKGDIPERAFYYAGPLVVLINGGSRSGKEILSYSLKKSKRAFLVGEKSAGFVLGGRLFQLDENCALYLAVLEGTIDGRNLEGQGVRPDLTVVQPKAGLDKQLAIGEKLLLARLRQAGGKQ